MMPATTPYDPSMTAVAARKARWSKRAAILPLLPALVFLVAFFAIPALFILRLSVADGGGQLSAVNFSRLLETPVYLRLLANTFKTAFFTTVICLIIGYPLAYVIATTTKRAALIITFIVLIPMWTSYLSRAIAWLTMLGRRGAVNQTLTQLGIIDRPLELVYNYPAVLTVMVHGFLPLAVITMVAVMQNIDPNLRKAASTLGASAPQAFWRVYFPISLPGVAAGALLVFVGSLGMFITPILIGSQQEATIAQAIIEQFDKAFDLNFAAALVAILLFSTLLCLALFNATTGTESLTGSPPDANRAALKPGSRQGNRILRTVLGGIARLTDLVGFAIDAVLRVLRLPTVDRMGRWPLRVAVAAILLFIMVPTLILLPLSLSQNRFMAWPPSGFTLGWYEAFFTSTKWRTATVTSIYLGVLSAGLALLLGVPAAFALSRRRIPFSALILAFITLPILVPHITVAVGLYYVLARIGLLGTDLSILIGHTIFALPYVVVTVMAVLRNYDRRLDQAAWTLGASPIVAFRRVTAPIIAAGLAAAFLFAFIQSFDELTMILFMGSANLTTLPKELWSAARSSLDPTLAAVSTLILLFVAVAMGTARSLQKKQ